MLQALIIMKALELRITLKGVMNLEVMYVQRALLHNSEILRRCEERFLRRSNPGFDFVVYGIA